METRRAAAEALGAVAAKVAEEEEEEEDKAGGAAAAAADALSSADGFLSLQELDLAGILAKAAPLLASGGEEFDPPRASAAELASEGAAARGQRRAAARQVRAVVVVVIEGWIDRTIDRFSVLSPCRPSGGGSGSTFTISSATTCSTWTRWSAPWERSSSS